MAYKRRDYEFEKRCCELAASRKAQPEPTVSKYSWASLKDYLRVLFAR